MPGDAPNANVFSDSSDQYSVERRKEPRVDKKFERAVISVLTDCTPQRLQAWIVNTSESGMALRTTTPIPISVPVRVDTEDRILLGEVSHCSQNTDGFLIGLQLEHVVEHVKTLLRLHQIIAEELNPQSRCEPLHRTE